MSKVINKHGIKGGCIYRIALENFVTYKRVELFPGPSLNLIIGPNGTGKSTFVCAIILGLCGKPKVIGRANKISEYVRSGCQNSTIEIELYREQSMRNVIIRRHFNLNDESTWSIDNETVREKQVQELIGSMNIQVDNLCQLLPQDRVQDFTKMNAQQLLRSTLSAVGGNKSVDQLDELIKHRTEQKELCGRLQNNEQLLQEKIRLNERLRNVIHAMEQRKQIEKQIELCERKKLWIEYNILREQVVQCLKDQKEKEVIVKRHQAELAPLEKFIKDAEEQISKLQQQKLNSNSKIYTLKEQVKEKIESVRQHEYLLKQVEDTFKEKIERHMNRERELQEAKAILEKLVIDKSQLMENTGNESHVKMQLTNLQNAINNTSAALENWKKKKRVVQCDLENNVMPQIRRCQNNIRQLENVESTRLNVLREYSEDTHAAVMWYRQNKNLFERPVYEPMMLEINFTDPKFARYLEATVSPRDLVAFTFESTRDMNKFLTIVRQEHGWKRVNAVCSEGGPVDMPQNDIQKLKYLGFYTYLVNTISAPDAILRYLCRNYQIHRIPIGNEHTYKNSGKVPGNITYFFAENHRFVVRVSTYSGEKSSSIIEIKQARLLANTVDAEAVDKCNLQLQRFEETSKSQKAEIQNFDKEISMLDSSLSKLNLQKKDISDAVDKIRSISVQIRIQNKKVQDIESEATFDIQQEKSRCRSKQKQFVINQCKLHSELKDIMSKLHGEMADGDIWKAKLEINRKEIVQQEKEIRHLRAELRNAQVDLENSVTLQKRTRLNATQKLEEAKKSCNGKKMDEDGFPDKLDFDVLPSNMEHLERHYHDLKARVLCMDKGDDQVIKEYQDRERLITRLRSDIENSSNTNSTIVKKIDKIKGKWLPPLENLLRDVDKNFGDMFAKLGCAGEIKLEKAGGDDDFDQYGISILVRFRESEQMSQLTRHTQSGGERALSTALYLMALQRLSTVPFRCVDEINQGMDPINERKMFELLVNVTTQCDSAQYFLLTPKLLSNLEYNPKIMVHTIMNGEKIMDYRKWNYSSFLKKAATYRP